MKENFSGTISQGLFEKLGRLTLELSANVNKAFVGPYVCSEAKNIRRRVDDDSRRLAIAYDRFPKWKERYELFLDSLSGLYLKGKTLNASGDSVRKFYKSYIDSEIKSLPKNLEYDMWYPALAALSTKNHGFTTPFETDDSLEKYEVELYKGVAAMCMPLIKDVKHPDPIDISLVNGKDPVFNVKKIITRKRDNLREKLTVRINTDTLRQMVDENKTAKRYLERAFPEGEASIENEKVYLIPSTIQGIEDYIMDPSKENKFYF